MRLPFNNNRFVIVGVVVVSRFKASRTSVIKGIKELPGCRSKQLQLTGGANSIERSPGEKYFVAVVTHWMNSEAVTSPKSCEERFQCERHGRISKEIAG